VTYENPRLPEGINVARESVPLEFLRLLAGLAIVVLVAALSLHAAGGWLARRIPFALESAWVGDRAIGFDGTSRAGVGASAAQEHLQRLAGELVVSMNLPRDMRVRVHLVPEPAPNAFATLGGHILVTEGLYRRLRSENALALLLAHEIAHVRARDPISAIGSGAALGLVMLALGRDAETLAPQFTRLVQLGYSRSAEARADAAAVAALEARYGHAGGAAALFDALAADHSIDRDVPTLLSTHPADAERVARLQAAARGWDPARQPLVPMPQFAP
jgi:beta-barrel assembly-enhancing protease